MSLENLEKAVSSTRAVLAHVQPTQMDDPSPCAKWSVRELINHIVGVQFFFAGALAGRPPSQESEDYASGDFLVAYEEGSSAMIARFADTSMDETFELPMGKLSGSQLMEIATSETFVHGWDLAKATHQNTNIAPDLAEALLHGTKTSFPDALRNEQGDPFGAQRDAPSDAPFADQVAAFLGRTV